jgi:hypothetical protein
MRCLYVGKRHPQRNNDRALKENDTTSPFYMITPTLQHAIARHTRSRTCAIMDDSSGTFHNASTSVLTSSSSALADELTLLNTLAEAGVDDERRGSWSTLPDGAREHWQPALSVCSGLQRVNFCPENTMDCGGKSLKPFGRDHSKSSKGFEFCLVVQLFPDRRQSTILVKGCKPSPNSDPQPLAILHHYC